MEPANPFLPPNDAPDPPGKLYKYVGRNRIDILSNLKIRFTPLLGTNDIFEVRRTFKLLWGPRFLSALEFEIRNGGFDMEARTAEILQKNFGLSVDEARAAAIPVLKNVLGEKFDVTFKSKLLELVRGLAPHLNADERLDAFLNKLAQHKLILSLSEDPHNPAMWTHYGESGRGFVIEFDTSNEFFSVNAATGSIRKPIKVQYFDDQIDELFDVPFKALAAKKTEWAYEKEWRLYAEMGDESDIIESYGNNIHLFNVPKESISAIILGTNYGDHMKNDIQSIVNDKLPHTILKKVTVPNKLSCQYVEVLIDR